MSTIKIDWDLIFNGDEHQLVEGHHYKNTYSFSKYIYQKARQRGVKIEQRISSDGKSIFLKVRKNEIVVRDYVNIELEEVEKSDVKIYQARNHLEEYPFERWFADLFLGGQKEIEVPKLNEFGNPIPIMREFPGGFKAPTGQYITEKKTVTFKPKEIIELKYPQDFSCTPRKMAAIFCEAIKSTGVIDVNQLHFNYKKKDRLIIKSGLLAKAEFEREEMPDNYNIWTNFNIKDAIPISINKASAWMDILKKEGQIVLKKTYDYAGDGDNLAALLRSKFPDIEFFSKTEKDPKLGWETLLLTIRLPLLTRLNVNISMKDWSNMEEGKLIEQPFEQQKLEYEEKKLKNIGYARQKYLEQYRALQLEISNIKEHAPEEMKEQFLEVINSQLNGMKEEFADLLSVEEQKYLEEYKEPSETLLLLENDYEI